MSTTPPAAPSADPGVPVIGSDVDPVTGPSGWSAADQGIDGAGMVRHEQQLMVATGWAATETVRIRKRIVTETRMVPVEVRIEVLEVDHLPVTGSVEEYPPEASRAPAELVIVLHEEVPVVSLEIRATERATVSVRTSTSHVSVTEQLHSEQVDVTTEPAASEL